MMDAIAYVNLVAYNTSAYHHAEEDVMRFLTPYVFKQIKQKFSEGKELHRDCDPFAKIEIIAAKAYLQSLFEGCVLREPIFDEDMIANNATLAALLKKLIRFFQIRPLKCRELDSPVKAVRDVLLLNDIEGFSAEITIEELLTCTLLYLIFDEQGSPSEDVKAYPLASKEMKAYYEAAEDDKTSIIKLCEKHCNLVCCIVGDDGVTYMHLAVTQGDASLVAQLLAVGADPNAQMLKTGNTPLMMAAAMQQVKVISVLLNDPKTKVDLKRRNGQTALDIALSYGTSKSAITQSISTLFHAASTRPCLMSRTMVDSNQPGESRLAQRMNP